MLWTPRKPTSRSLTSSRTSTCTSTRSASASSTSTTASVSRRSSVGLSPYVGDRRVDRRVMCRRCISSSRVYVSLLCIFVLLLGVVLLRESSSRCVRRRLVSCRRLVACRHLVACRRLVACVVISLRLIIVSLRVLSSHCIRHRRFVVCCCVTFSARHCSRQYIHGLLYNYFVSGFWS